MRTSSPRKGNWHNLYVYTRTSEQWWAIGPSIQSVAVPWWKKESQSAASQTIRWNVNTRLSKRKHVKVTTFIYLVCWIEWLSPFSLILGGFDSLSIESFTRISSSPFPKTNVDVSWRWAAGCPVTVHRSESSCFRIGGNFKNNNRTIRSRKMRLEKCPFNFNSLSLFPVRILHTIVKLIYLRRFDGVWHGSSSD